MIHRDHDLSIARQASALGISRGSVYYLLQRLLKAEGHCVGRRHVATLMKKMGIEALCRRSIPRSRRRGTRSIPISCAISPAHGPTNSGRWTLHAAPRPGWSGVHMTGMH